MILQTETEWLTGMCEHAHEKTNIMLIVQLITRIIYKRINWKNTGIAHVAASMLKICRPDKKAYNNSIWNSLSILIV